VSRQPLLLFVFCLLTFAGCATVPLVTPPKIEDVPGFYHRVEKGQTLWRISRMYNLDLKEIVKINRISDAASIEVGQSVFIPQQKKEPPKELAPREDFIWPIRGKVISGFGQIFNHMVNKGLNIKPLKAQDVVAARSGKIVFYSPDFAGFGQTIIIDHGDEFRTVYAVSSEVFIKIGDHIKKGDSIAKTKGADDYLHFEIRKAHKPENPYFYLSP
jgi:hypothetical protein